jgi:site-specific DNA-methyltransferase (adenine-specific)/modification methylase
MNIEEITSYKLLNTNSLEFIKTLPDNSIDMIFTDPPYDLPDSPTKKSLLELNENIENLPDDIKKEYTFQFARIIKEKGNIALFCGYVDKFKWYQYFKDNNLLFKRELIWIYKNSPSIRLKIRNFNASYESCLLFTKPDKDNKSNFYFHKDTPKDEFNTKNWILHNVQNGFLKGTEDTPKNLIGTTPKPLKVARWIIKPLTKEKDIVLDTFMGTGSHGIASLQLDRKFIGIEINKNIFEFTQNRFLKFKNQLKLNNFF